MSDDAPSGPLGTATISTRASVQIQMPVAAVRDRADPCTMVICGALGDLSRRKLLPAIYHLMREQLVHRGPDSVGAYLSSDARAQ